MSKEKQTNASAEEEILQEENAAAEALETEEAPAEQTAEVDALAEEQAKNAELSDRLMRTMAEFDNFKKRTAREKQDIGSFARAACVKELLGVCDNFERALSVECKDPDFYKGMEMIFKMMQDSFTKLGVTEIEALNQPFDPNLHNAVMQREDEAFGENTVCQVLQKGYMIDGHVIRHAMVAVANP